jgi:hypothetical protein
MYREIFDSMDNPTVEAEVFTSGGFSRVLGRADFERRV